MWERYQTWASSSQGTWVAGMGFFFIAVLNVVTGHWLLAGVMVLTGLVLLVRAWRRARQSG
jgi:hypothetical protein